VTCRDDPDAGPIEAIEESEEAFARNGERIADTDSPESVGDISADRPDRLGLRCGLARGFRRRRGFRR
jgi:hypothetical protein